MTQLMSPPPERVPVGPPRRAVLAFDDEACRDAAMVGPKAAVLAQLSAVMPRVIPAGFVLPPVLAAALADAPSDELRACIASEVKARLDSIGGNSVAVRSSALEEDGADRSYAGQYETVLGVGTAAAVLDAAARCVSSGRAARVDAYRRMLAGRDCGAVAVLVQRMVAAERSGVAFTVNPVTGASQVVINATYGLGETLVSGEITPDEVVLDDEDRILALRVGTKRDMVLLSAGTVQRVVVPLALQAQPALSVQQAAQVAAAARACETQLGVPVDVEWAIAEGVVHVLQARPVTVLPGGRHGR